MMLMKKMKSMIDWMNRMGGGDNDGSSRGEEESKGDEKGVDQSEEDEQQEDKQ